MMGDGLPSEKSKRYAMARHKMMGPMGLMECLPKETAEECMPEETAEECKRANNARGTVRILASMVAMLGKMWGPHLQTGLATMWIGQL